MTPPTRDGPTPLASIDPRPYRRWLAVLLLVSYGLRVWLACLGGQGFWADEDRYQDGRLAARYLLHGQWHDAGQELLGHPDHILFRWFSVPPGLYEEMAGSHPAAVAAYFGLFSVGVIYLVWRIARRAGAGEAEAWWGAYMAACANTLFYYSRHFFPYDIALCAMLGGLALALGRGSVRNSLLVGAAAGFGFLVYNGYWLLGGCVLALYSLLGDGGWRRIWFRAVWSGVGLVASIVPIVAAGRILGIDLIAEDYKWGVIARGDFPFGHRVTAGYLWYGEGGLLLLWLAALGYALAGSWRERRWGRLAWYVGGLVLVLAGLLVLSDIVPLFTLQGRRVRCAVPFLCLCAGYGINGFLARRPRGRRGWTIVIAVLAAVLAAINFSQPFRQVFPSDFQRLSARTIRAAGGFDAYRLAFAQSLWGVSLDTVLPSSPPLLESRHPLQFRPYQYEGYDTAQRADINRHDVTMRLFRIPVGLDRAADRWAGYPGPVRWSVIFPSNREGQAEPLVTSGETGRGDFLFVRYVDRHRIAFGLDHWGSGAAISPPIEVDYAQPHEIVLSLGSLLPPADSGFFRQFPDRARWRTQVLVILDGRTVFHWVQETWPASPGNLSFGVNLIGGTAAQLSFTGQILGLDADRSAGIGRAMDGAVVGALVENSWAKAPVPDPALADPGRPGQQDVPGRDEHVVGVRFRLSGDPAAPAQPLLLLKRTDRALGLLAIRQTDRELSIGWRDVAGWWWSPPLTVPVGGPHRVEMQWNRIGGFAPTPAQELQRQHAAQIMVDGTIFSHPRPAFFDVPMAEVAGWHDAATAEPAVAPVFGGRIEPAGDVASLLLARERVPATRRIHLAVLFPTNRPGRNEPLITAGHTGAADGLFVHYEAPGLIRIGFDHWGEGGPLTDPLPVTAGYQTIEVEFGRGSWPEPKGGDLRVWLNGRSVVRESSDFYPVTPQEVTVGKNPIGLSTSDPEFTGQLFPIEDDTRSGN